MADHYLQFSFAIPNITETEAEWIRKYLGHVVQFAELEQGYDPDVPLDDETVLTDADLADQFLMITKENGSLGFEWEIDEDGLWIYAEEGGDPDNTALFIQKFLTTHRPTSYVGFEWAATCSKMQLNEFGGGGVMVTATDCEFISTGLWISQQGDVQQARGLTAA